MKKRVIIMGAGGRDFHNFLVYFKDNPAYEVVCFTAAQIPGIEKRKFPKELAGRLYKDIPIFPEEKLPELIKKYKIDEVVLSYSDLSHQEVMEKASIALAAGSSFRLLGPNNTMLKSKKPVISICAVRTGAGKSQTSRKIADIIKSFGKKIVMVRHPMPYSQNLMKQVCQRFTSYKDLDKYETTIEEREEYEPWIERKIPIYAGLDYEKILRQAEKEADIIGWDGGNNDFPFFKPNLQIVVVDPHRAGHELTYYPGFVNFLMADVIVINKIDSAPKKGIKIIEDNIKKYNPKAAIIKAKSKIIVDNPQLIKNKRVLLVEDGPTITHGGMKFGAATVAAKIYGAKDIVNAKKYAVGSIKETYKKYPHLEKELPAMGYSKSQIKDLQETINKSNCDLVIDGSPVNLSKLIKSNKQIVNVSYELEETGATLKDILKKFRFI